MESINFKNKKKDTRQILVRMYLTYKIDFLSKTSYLKLLCTQFIQDDNF